MSRTETLKADRRRRNTEALGGRARKLGLDERKLDRENFVYRWAVDEGTRLHELTVNDDWEVVADRSGTLKADGSGTGAEIAVPTVAGSGAVKQILLRKPKSYHEDDKRKSLRRIDETEAGLKSGAVPGAGSDGAYVPRNGISITRS